MLCTKHQNRKVVNMPVWKIVQKKRNLSISKSKLVMMVVMMVMMMVVVVMVVMVVIVVMLVVMMMVVKVVMVMIIAHRPLAQAGRTFWEPSSATTFSSPPPSWGASSWYISLTNILVCQIYWFAKYIGLPKILVCQIYLFDKYISLTNIFMSSYIQKSPPHWPLGVCVTKCIFFRIYSCHPIFLPLASWCAKDLAGIIDYKYHIWLDQIYSWKIILVKYHPILVGVLNWKKYILQIYSDQKSSNPCWCLKLDLSVTLVPLCPGWKGNRRPFWWLKVAVTYRFHHHHHRSHHHHHHHHYDQFQYEDDDEGCGNLQVSSSSSSSLVSICDPPFSMMCCSVFSLVTTQRTFLGPPQLGNI